MSKFVRILINVQFDYLFFLSKCPNYPMLTLAHSYYPNTLTSQPLNPALNASQPSLKASQPKFHRPSDRNTRYVIVGLGFCSVGIIG
ncbi:hypothetical protein QQG55_2395 [Brugia pahangi]